jgi:hypothetical protein
MCNDDYDFSKLTKIVDSKAMEYLFGAKVTIMSSSRSSIFDNSNQSSVFICSLKIVCEELGFENFYKGLHLFLEQ